MSDEELLAQLLSELEQTEPYVGDESVATGETWYADTDQPEVPDSGLPPLPGASSSAPSRTTPVQSGAGITTPEEEGTEVTIQPDSIVDITVEEDSGLNGSYKVNDIGAVVLGYVGPVILYNKTEAEAEAKIVRELERRYFRQATVSVKIIRPSYDKIQVAGAVIRPSLIKIGAGDKVSLNDALLRAGGIRPSAKGTMVKIVKDGMLSPFSMALDGEYYTLVSKEGKPTVPDVMLDNNDIAYVFSISEAVQGAGEVQVLVLGEVKRQGYYRFKPGEPSTMMNLIFKMGGLPPWANKKEIKVLRRDEEGTEKEYEVNVKEILKYGDPEDDFVLENGDRIIVPEVVIRPLW